MKSSIPLTAYIEAYLASLPPSVDAAADADALAEALETIKPLRSFVADVTMAADVRLKALETALPKTQPATCNLALVLAQDGRLKDAGRLPELVRAAQAAKTGKRAATVASASPLSAQNLKRVAAAVENLIGMPVTLEERTDTALLAGIRVSVGDWEFDASLKNRLERLQHVLTV